MATQQPVYWVNGQRLAADEPNFAAAISIAHAHHLRPRCLCVQKPRHDGHEGIEMYIARLAFPNAAYIVKRMPNTGHHHAPACPSYEPPPELSGIGQVLDTPIQEDPATGETTLWLGFAMSQINVRSTNTGTAQVNDSVISDGSKLSLRALLHYLWDQAELTRWQPSFTGKRSWATVRKHLLQAANGKFTRSGSLHGRLYIPEVFSVEKRDAINARRIAQWAPWKQASTAHNIPQRLMLLIAEVKEVVPWRYGYKAVIKHLPDECLAMDEQLYRRMARRFETELTIWGATDNLHMLMIATFGIGERGVPTITELSLMLATQQWLPVENAAEASPSRA